MPFAVIKLHDDNITIETVFPTVEKCNQYIQQLNNITLNTTKKIIQGHISQESEIDMDGYYIKLDKVHDLYQIIERKTIISSGWIVNSIYHKCQPVGSLYIRELPKSTDNIQNPQSTNMIVEPSTQLCQPIKSTEKTQPKQLSTITYTHNKLFNSPELIAELMEKIKNKNKTPSGTLKVKSE